MARLPRSKVSPSSTSARAGARATVVTLVMGTHGRKRSVQVRALRTGRVYFECFATDLRGAELAVLAAERYCTERGFVVVIAANDTLNPRSTRAA